ncbi:multidrug and toxin extrusion protein 1-like [Larimichthys crocea]|uniref:multidrug and toxin extrusion protein 1-like n=1 Tax=Larimichthys crocea TaxID=215358 RepID=UPI000F5F3ADE|nr:multidrug and toxin extrusion protein 1-like [Larimichthys crocea]
MKPTILFRQEPQPPPELRAAFMYMLQGKYLQNQGIMWPQAITGGVGNALNAVINYIFLYPLKLGVAGSAAANAISQYFLALFLYFYIRWRGLHKATWGGWSLDCLQEWGPFIKLAIPSMLMICLPWWILEIGVFLAGAISEVELDAQSIVYQLCVVAFMFAQGFSAAACVRVGSALGAGNIEQAKLSSKVSIICTCKDQSINKLCLFDQCGSNKKIMGMTSNGDIILQVSAISCILCIIFIGWLGVIFITKSSPVFYSHISAVIVSIYFFYLTLISLFFFSDIIQRFFKVMVIFVFFIVADATAGVAASVLRGAGKQLIGALWNLVAVYFIGFPIGVSLMFAANMGIVGLWTGLTICGTLQAIVFITVLWKLDWIKAAEEAFVRAGVRITVEKEMDEVEHSDSNHSQAKVSATLPKTVSAEEDDADLEAHDPSHSLQQFSTTTVGDVLSVKQLILRRGLTLLVMIFILIAGIVARLNCSNDSS